MLFDARHLACERLDLLEQQVPPPLLAGRGQLQPAEPRQPRLRPQAGSPRGTTPAPRSSARTAFLARVRLAIGWLRRLTSSRQARTSGAGTCTVGVSPRYRSFSS